MICWEYRKFVGPQMSDSQLDEFGADGWELASLLMLNGAFFYIFKKPYQE